LLRGGDEVEILVFSVAADFVELVIEVTELAGLSHDLLLQEEGRLQQIVSTFMQEIDTVIDQCVVEKYPHTLEEVSAMTSDVLTPLRVVPAECLEYFVVVESSAFVGDLESGDVAPRADHFVVVLVVADTDGVVDEIADGVDEFIDFLEEECFTLFDFFLLEFIGVLELEFVLAGVFFVGLLLVADGFADVVPLHFEAVEGVAD
jgi:hypothetical protein